MHCKGYGQFSYKTTYSAYIFYDISIKTGIQKQNQKHFQRLANHFLAPKTVYHKFNKRMSYHTRTFRILASPSYCFNNN